MAAPKNNKITTLLRGSLSAFIYTALFSLLINLLMLTVPLYMLQIFDRVLSSQSIDTLVYLTIIAVVALLVLALLDIARARILVQVSRWIDHRLSPLALSRSMDNLLQGGQYGGQSLKDITNVRQFLSGPSVFAIFDTPWVPIYIMVVYFLHVMLGVIATVGAIVLFALAIANEIASRRLLNTANKDYLENQNSIDAAMDNAETIQAMGMLPQLVKSWFSNNEKVLNFQSDASRRSALILSTSKFIRMVLQLVILGMGAYLIILGQLGPGAMIAASIITARALAPVEQAISAWKQSVSAYQAYGRLKKYLESPVLRDTAIQLPKPTGALQVDNVVYIPMGAKKPIVQGVNFSIASGETLAIIGPSGAGKSTLARLMLGVWPANNGAVRLDGANIYTWDREDLGQHVGYLEQNVNLFSGTVKDNIARMMDGSDQSIIAAAKLADAHDMILRLPKGYDSNAGRFHLSGGQNQRVALARAFYGKPRMIVLDEPETNLDKEGLLALDAALRSVREKGITVVIVSQRANVIDMADKVLLMNRGLMQAFGEKDAVMQKIQEQAGKMQADKNPGKETHGK